MAMTSDGASPSISAAASYMILAGFPISVTCEPTAISWALSLQRALGCGQTQDRNGWRHQSVKLTLPPSLA